MGRGERYKTLAEYYRAEAVAAWQRVAHATSPEAHRYRGQATALRQQAASTRFQDIRARLLAIAEKYESIADFIEQAMRTRPPRRACTAPPQVETRPADHAN